MPCRDLSSDWVRSTEHPRRVSRGQVPAKSLGLAPLTARERSPRSEAWPRGVAMLRSARSRRWGSTPTGAKATLSLSTSPKVPADLTAEVLSVSAVGEQYVDLRPRTDSPPYLHDGSVIAVRDTTIPQPVGPMLDQVSALVNSIPKTKLGQLLDESFQGFNGSGYDLGSLFDSSEDSVPRRQRCRRSHPRPHRRHWAAVGYASTHHRFDQNMGT